MTEIRWKNGGPLFLQPTPGSEFGLVATEQNCCCPPPPPPRCWDCLDTCSYFIEVTSPGSLAVKSPPRDCGAPSSCSRVDTDYLLEPPKPDEYPNVTFSNSGSAACSGTATGRFLNAGLSHIRTSYGGEPFDGNPFTPGGSLQVDSGIAASVACIAGNEPTPFRLYLVANVFVTMSFGDDYATSSWIAIAEFDLPSTCSAAPNRQCGDYTGEFRLLDTPVELTANGTDTSLGAYQAASSESSGSLAEEAEEIREAIRGQLTGTFRITSRPSCEPCETCADCEFPTTPQFQQGGSIECFGVGTQNSTVGQDVYIGLPPGGLPNGVSWKSGYPVALNNCEWAFVVDSLTIDCCYEDCIVNGVQQNIIAGKTRNRYRILLMTCPDGPESVQVTDITDLAVQGDLEVENDNKPAGCPGPPIACTEWFGYFPAPQPVCNEFP